MIDKKMDKYLIEGDKVSTLYSWEMEDISKMYSILISSRQRKVLKIISDHFRELEAEIRAVLEEVEDKIDNKTEAEHIIGEIFMAIPIKTYNQWPVWYEKLYSKYSDYRKITAGGPRPRGKTWAGTTLYKG